MYLVYVKNGEERYGWAIFHKKSEALRERNWMGRLFNTLEWYVLSTEAEYLSKKEVAVAVSMRLQYLGTDYDEADGCRRLIPTERGEIFESFCTMQDCIRKQKDEAQELESGED